MKKHIAHVITLLFVFTVAMVLPAMAQNSSDHSSHSHGSTEDAPMVMKKGKSAAGDAMDHSKMDHDVPAKVNDGKNWIRKTNIKGHHFAYELIDMREKLKGMPGMKNTHHLMVFIKDAQGNNLGKAKVGYLIKGPDDVSQKAMCMGMGGGFGSDVDLGKPGTYLIKAKVAAGGTKLMDTFEYRVK